MSPFSFQPTKHQKHVQFLCSFSQETLDIFAPQCVLYIYLRPKMRKAHSVITLSVLSLFQRRVLFYLSMVYRSHRTLTFSPTQNSLWPYNDPHRNRMRTYVFLCLWAGMRVNFVYQSFLFLFFRCWLLIWSYSAYCCMLGANKICYRIYFAIRNVVYLLPRIRAGSSQSRIRVEISIGEFFRLR